MSACASRKLLQQGVGQRSGVVMADHPAGFFQGTEMPTAGWWEALWPDPAGVLAAVGLRPGTDVIDLCSGDGWFTFQIAKVARHVTAIDIVVGGRTASTSGKRSSKLYFHSGRRLRPCATKRTSGLYFHGKCISWRP